MVRPEEFRRLLDNRYHKKRRKQRRRKTLEKVLIHARVDGPGVIVKLGVRLHAHEARALARILSEEGNPTEAYDFPGTIRIWQEENWAGVPYRVLGTKKLIVIQSYLAGGIDYRTEEGFDSLLPYLTAEAFERTVISRHGRTLCGMLGSVYKGSTPKAILECIDYDAELQALRGRYSEDMFRGPTDTRTKRVKAAYRA